MEGKKQETSPGVQELLRPFLNRWYWFVLGAIVALAAGFFYLRYDTKVYTATGVILIKDTSSSSGSSELAALEGLGGLGNSFNAVENEIGILNSRRLTANVIQKLNLHTEYYLEGQVKTTMAYRDAPVVLNIVNKDAIETMAKGLTLLVTPISESRYKYSIGNSKKEYRVDFGTPITKNGIEFFIVPNPKLDKSKINKLSDVGNSNTTIIQVMPLEQTVNSYYSRLNAAQVGRSGSMVSLSMTSPDKNLSQDFVDALVDAYNDDAINDANKVAQNTAAFIEERLRIVQQDLDSVESGLQSFKRERNITDLTAETGLEMTKFSGLEGQLVQIDVQKDIANALKRNVAVLGTDFIPENVGVESPELSAQSARYNQLLLAYRNQLKSATEENPAAIQLKTQLDAVKQSVTKTLESYTRQLDIKQSSIRRELSSSSGQMSQVPLSEKLNRGIERNRTVIESIYLLLSERREATAIALAITAPKAKIIDKAYGSSSPENTPATTIYAGCVLLGLLIPFGIIFVYGLLYNKIESRKDLETSLADISIIGEIPKLTRNSPDRIVKNDRSILAESFRILRTNLQFKLGTLKIENRATRILVTSTIKGEGKTFVAYNLAVTLANSGKSVLLIGADIRNPQIHRYLKGISKSTAGVTEFLSGSKTSVYEIIAQIEEIPKLYVMLSGIIPPNPAELWMQGKTAALFEQVDQQFDVILLDTSPTILVTDTLLLKDYADLTVYVTRANYTDKPFLNYIKELVKDNKLVNVSLVINDVKSMNLGYGNKYGYTYNDEKSSGFSIRKKR